MGSREIGHDDVALLQVAQFRAWSPAVMKLVQQNFNFAQCFVSLYLDVIVGAGCVDRVKSEAEIRKKNISTLVLTARMGVVKKGDERVGSVGKVRATKYRSRCFFEVLRLYFRQREASVGGSIDCNNNSTRVIDQVIQPNIRICQK